MTPDILTRDYVDVVQRILAEDQRHLGRGGGGPPSRAGSLHRRVGSPTPSQRPRERAQ